MINTTTISISICDVCSASEKTDNGLTPAGWSKLYLTRLKSFEEFSGTISYLNTSGETRVDLASFDVCPKCLPPPKEILKGDKVEIKKPARFEVEKQKTIFQKMFARSQA